MSFFYTVFETTFGKMAVVWKRKGVKVVLARIFLPQGKSDLVRLIRKDYPGASEAEDVQVAKLAADLKAYLEGVPVAFHGFTLDFSGWSPFAKKVYGVQARMCRGSVLSYAALARKAGAPKAARVVGTLQARNPFPLLIPCHRIVRSDGCLGEFQTGQKMKARLLENENISIRQRNGQYYVCLEKR